MCLHYYHVGVYDETAEQIDIIDLTRTTVDYILFMWVSKFNICIK